jgi:hypothetical protein
MLTKLINNFYSFRKIIKLNKRIFKDQPKKTKNEILIEFNNFAASHISLSYCANILKNKHNANLTAYPGHVLLSYPLKQKLIKKIKYFFGKVFNINFFGVYKSFGINKFHYPKINDHIKKLADHTHKKFLKDIKSLRQLEHFKIKKILMGDLLYDTYLKNHYHLSPTINLNNKEFQKFAFDFICLFYIWDHYINTKNIKAIISSHAVYTIGLPARICASKKIETYILTHEQIWKLKDLHPTQYYEVHKFKKIFKKIKIGKQKKLKELAKQRLEARLKGAYTSDYSYITKSPFGINKKIKISKKKKNIFVIATHDFVDAPHAMGHSLFPDFYQWFIYLCEVSKKTEDIWLVKNHPDFGEDYSKYVQYERDVTNNICSKYKNIKVLHKDTTLNDLVKIKVDAVFTVNGTIGVDMSILNIPVINASLNNPHINYKFNYHPKSVKELEDIILNFRIHKKKIKIDKNEIYEFYAMRNIYFSKNWFYPNLNKIIKDIKSYHNLSKPMFYDYWVKNYDSFDEKLTVKNLKKYFYSKNIFLLNNNKFGKY